MKVLFVFLLLSSPVFAQNRALDTGIAPGCGEDNIKFAVKTGTSNPGTIQPNAGKAVVYFVEEDSQFGSFPKPTTRSGIDGKWVGATHGNSYFYVSVDPGEHHLCASWQTGVIVGQGHKTAAAHFTAKAGIVYYFEIKNAWASDVGKAQISLRPLDSDEWLVLARRSSFSSSRPKKS